MRNFDERPDDQIVNIAGEILLSWLTYTSTMFQPRAYPRSHHSLPPSYAIFSLYFLLRFYVLEGFLLRRLYGSIYTGMDDTTRRSFLNHHFTGFVKIIILLVAAYPFVSVTLISSIFTRRLPRVAT